MAKREADQLQLEKKPKPLVSKKFPLPSLVKKVTGFVKPAAASSRTTVLSRGSTLCGIFTKVSGLKRPIYCYGMFHFGAMFLWSTSRKPNGAQ